MMIESGTRMEQGLQLFKKQLGTVPHKGHTAAFMQAGIISFHSRPGPAHPCHITCICQTAKSSHMSSAPVHAVLLTRAVPHVKLWEGPSQALIIRGCRMRLTPLSRRQQMWHESPPGNGDYRRPP